MGGFESSCVLHEPWCDRARSCLCSGFRFPSFKASTQRSGVAQYDLPRPQLAPRSLCTSLVRAGGIRDLYPPSHSLPPPRTGSCMHHPALSLCVLRPYPRLTRGYGPYFGTLACPGLLCSSQDKQIRGLGADKQIRGLGAVYTLWS